MHQFFISSNNVDRRLASEVSLEQRSANSRAADSAEGARRCRELSAEYWKRQSL